MPFEVDRVVGVVKGGTLRKNSSITEDVHIIRTAADNVDRLVFLRSTKKKKKKRFLLGKKTVHVARYLESRVDACSNVSADAQEIVGLHRVGDALQVGVDTKVTGDQATRDGRGRGRR